MRTTLNFWLYLFGVLAIFCSGTRYLPLIYTSARLAMRHETTTGVVVGVRRTPFDIFRTAKNPPRLIEFKVDGKTYQVVSLIQGGKKPAYEKGRQVEVIYDPQNPDIARVGGEGGLSTTLIAAMCFAPLALLQLLVREVRKMIKSASAELS